MKKKKELYIQAAQPQEQPQCLCLWGWRSKDVSDRIILR